MNNLKPSSERPFARCNPNGAAGKTLCVVHPKPKLKPCTINRALHAPYGVTTYRSRPRGKTPLPRGEAVLESKERLCLCNGGGPPKEVSRDDDGSSSSGSGSSEVASRTRPRLFEAPVTRAPLRGRQECRTNVGGQSEDRRGDESEAYKEQYVYDQDRHLDVAMVAVWAGACANPHGVAARLKPLEALAQLEFELLFFSEGHVGAGERPYE